MSNLIMPEKRIKAVLFDLGGTLLTFGKVNSFRLFRSAARGTYAFLKQAGQPVSSFRYYFWRNFVSVRLHYAFSSIIRKDFDSLALLKRAGVKRGIRLRDEQWERLSWLWYEPLSEIAKAEADIVATMSKLKEAGLRLGIVSNTFVHGVSLDKHLAKVGILDFLPVRVYSYNFGFRKPDRRIFEAAAQQIGCSPEPCVFVGDQIDTDIKGALRAGMHAVLKNTCKNHSRKIPRNVLRIEAIRELPEVIKRIVDF